MADRRTGRTGESRIQRRQKYWDSQRNTHEGRHITVSVEGYLDVHNYDLQRNRSYLVKSSGSPGGAWRLLNQHYRTSGHKEMDHLAGELNSMRMGIGEHSEG